MVAFLMLGKCTRRIRWQPVTVSSSRNEREARMDLRAAIRAPLHLIGQLDLGHPVSGGAGYRARGAIARIEWRSMHHLNKFFFYLFLAWPAGRQ